MEQRPEIGKAAEKKVAAGAQDALNRKASREVMNQTDEGTRIQIEQQDPRLSDADEAAASDSSDSGGADKNNDDGNENEG